MPAEEAEVLQQGSHRVRAFLALAATSFVMLFLLAACETNRHPDVKDAVNSALTNNNLGTVSVSQDRAKGVITLKGDVESNDQKAQASVVASQVAPGYTIANEIGVRPSGQESQAKAVDSNLDDAIEDNFKASLKAHKSLDEQSISASAKNGTLVLTGHVKSRAQKAEAQQLAKAVPNVKQVVNEIEVR